MHRTPSSCARPTIGSNVRRRSVGATAYRNHAKRLSAEDSFPGAHSQPTVSVPGGETITCSQGSLDVPPDRSQNHLVVAVHSGEDYHMYNLSASDELSSSSEYSAESHYAEDPANPSSAALYTNVAAVASSESSSSSEDLPLGALVISLRDRVTPSNPNDNCQHPAEKANQTILDNASGHAGLIPHIGTTNKFTNKWPKPKTVRNFGPFSLDLGLGDTGSMRQTHSGAPALGGGRFGLNYLSRWTGFKWCLFFSVMSVFACGCAGLISGLMTWFNAWDKANVMVVANNDILILITLSGFLFLLTALLGLTGTILNSRPILAVYAILLWPAFLSLLSIGYNSYRRSNITLDNKLSSAWSRHYTALGRQLIQDSLQCCGYFSSMHEASPSKRCYLRTPLPGCSVGLYEFERKNLRTIWKIIFSLAPLHLINMVIALICANHTANVFGKRVLPQQYRLRPNDVKADAEKLVGFGLLEPPSPVFPEKLDEERALLMEKRE